MAPSSAHAEAEDRKLRKDPSGGPCFEGTLQKPTGVSESSPVAGTIENSTFSESLDAGRTREIQTNYDPAATLLLSVNCLYQMNKKNCKGEFEKCVRLPIWCSLDLVRLSILQERPVKLNPRRAPLDGRPKACPELAEGAAVPT